MDECFQIINSIRSLDDLRVRLRRIAKAWSLSKRQLFEINLIIEEICMNYIEHSECVANSSIGVHLSLGESVVSITITDKGPGFDPTKVSDSDVCLPMEQRKAGGLGLCLVKHFTDKISYVRVNDTNTLCIEKKI